VYKINGLPRHQEVFLTITGFLDFVHRLEILYTRKHNVSETDAVILSVIHHSSEPFRFYSFFCYSLYVRQTNFTIPHTPYKFH
jgi:hypothetical protein